MSDDVGARPESAGRVPLEDTVLGTPIYSPRFGWWAAAGAVLGALALGIPAWGVAAGVWPNVFPGQFVATGTGLATFVGAGVGVAAGGLAGALLAVFRLPERRSESRSGAG